MPSNNNQRYYVPCCDCRTMVQVGKGTAARYGRGESCVLCTACQFLDVSRGVHSIN